MARLLLSLVLITLAIIAIAQGRRCVRQDVAPRPCANLHALQGLALSEFQGKWLFVESMLLEGYRKTFVGGRKKKRVSRLGKTCVLGNKKRSQCRLLQITDTSNSQIKMNATTQNYARNGTALSAQAEAKHFVMQVSNTTENGKWRIETGIYPKKAKLDVDVLLLAAEPSKFALAVLCSTVKAETWEGLSAAQVSSLPLYLQPQHNYHASAAMIVARRTEQPEVAITPAELDGLRERTKSLLGIPTYQPDRIGAYC